MRMPISAHGERSFIVFAVSFRLKSLERNSLRNWCDCS